MANDADKEYVELSQQTPLELEKLTQDERQVRALKLERWGLAKRGLDDRVKEVDAELKALAAKGRKANANTADSTPLETREA